MARVIAEADYRMKLIGIDKVDAGPNIPSFFDLLPLNLQQNPPAMDALRFKSTTSVDTRCLWCENQCQRTFVDVRVPGGPGRPQSKIPLRAGWDRIIVNNACPKGLIEDPKEVKRINERIESGNNAYPLTPPSSTWPLPSGVVPLPVCLQQLV